MRGELHGELKELKSKRFTRCPARKSHTVHPITFHESGAPHCGSQRTTAPALGINTCVPHTPPSQVAQPRAVDPWTIRAPSIHAPLHPCHTHSCSRRSRQTAALGRRRGGLQLLHACHHTAAHLAHGACRGVHRLSPWRPRARALAPSPGHPWLDQGSWRRSPRRRRRRRRRTRPRLRPWTLHRWRS